MLLSYVLNLGYACAALALTTIGLAIVFGLLGVLNMAHGEFVMLGAYSVVVVQRLGLSALLAVPLAIVVCAAIGWIVERLLVRPLYQRPFDTLLATWGVAILLREGVAALFGKGYQDVTGAYGASIDVLGTQYPAFRLAVMLAVGVAFAGLAGWYSRSQMGARIRGMVANPLLAKAVGINTPRLASGTFIMGVVLAGLAGVLLAPIVRVEPYMGLDYLLNSFFVLVVGGLGSLLGLAVGTLVIGGTQVAVSSFIDQTSGYTAVLILSVYFLWSRPNGLVSRR
ncbi:branched-chain amino acid ABC transporter permease [Burkholderia gladioli]|uniref:branched-chain amino acid ABC transporter permease n=1 Tax=Burkholderia gladioli TaxID=28095 RepID=UPI001364B32D|nr:branched-chain amino acid ABC transporter permease [Burkholderia gladioli]KAF1058692.1 High-affinity branched-chain amino acid transport system permease protein LivH [Burkholderia gladioli]WAG24758.1 branched-chain amino acid ABC transporter permease [Burkholderia gladioli]